MAFPSFAPEPFAGRRLSLAEIDAVVSARLGPTHGLDNSQSTCFNRQVAMYLAARVGRWSSTVIGGFYNGCDHSTVCYGIQRIESLRESDPEVDALVSELKQKLGAGAERADGSPELSRAPIKVGKSVLSQAELERIADLIAAKVCAVLNPRAD